ncbi:MAG: hypothetical protein AAGI53_09870 [Planctomycetota bacterium]
MGTMHNPQILLPTDLKYVCDLGSAHGAVRTLGLARGDRAVVCYAVRAEGGRRDAEAFVERLRGHASVEHAHVLPIQDVELAPDGMVFLLTPYTGNPDGLVTLADLATVKAGQASPFEVGRGVHQLLEASVHAHALGLYQGPFTSSDVLVDPHGSLLIELYGISRVLAGLDCTQPRLARDEVNSIASIAYHMLTGMDAAEPRVRASRLVKRLDRVWDVWFDEALDPSGGFETAAEALAALPGQGVVETRPTNSGGVFARLRRAVGTESVRHQD